ncbi:hypothetical protein SKAU_G00280740 [Synaphobranchus kaupii]|uniref:Uncharacterized protein n=1 Tax=Synaphobranchus kaupii TaxID=118154 RepID=A0A9Q1IP02_SYNKA|nr:hypothetical protein SKAU_G00280740 [Synaphobranchus kaupii]
MTKVTHWSFENGGCAAEERRVWEATFYNTIPIVVSQELEEEAQRIAFPESRRTPLQHTGPSGLATLIGRVVEYCEEGCGEEGDSPCLKCKDRTGWLQSHSQPVAGGHNLGGSAGPDGHFYTPHVHCFPPTSASSGVLEETEVIRMIKVIGASILEGKEVEILLEGLDVLKVAADVWEVICPQRAYPISLKVKTKAGWIVCAEAEAEE